MEQHHQVLPDPAPVLSLLDGFRRSKVLFTLVGLGIPDILGDVTATLGQVVQAVGERCLSGPASPDGLQRLLDAAVSLGLLHGSAAAGYSLTPVSRTYLVSSSEYALTGYINHSDKLLYKLWNHLDAAVLTGNNCWQRAFGLDGKDVFASLYGDDQALLRFLNGMHSFAKLCSKPLLTAFDLSPFKSLVDLGGATGALAVAACQLHPAMHAVVVDLPHVVAAAQQHFTKPPYVADAAVLQRLSWVAADFFGEQRQDTSGSGPGGEGQCTASDVKEQQQQRPLQEQQQQRPLDEQQQQRPPQAKDSTEQHGDVGNAKEASMQDDHHQLPQGDLYVLCRILHDWDDARCLQLLRRVHAGLLPGGAILVCEMLLDESGTSPPEALLQSLNMLTQTHGRERQLSEFRQLLQAAGFAAVQGRRTGAGLDAVIAYKQGGSKAGSS